MLVGRTPEVRTIGRLVAGARLGQAGALAILGEPGIGKTALVDHVVTDLADGFALLRATGTETEQDLAFAGLSQLLRPALGLLDQIPAPQADALATALALRTGRPGDRFAIGAATLSLLCRYAEQAPVTVIVDDLHLLDRPSAEALIFAARRLHTDPVVVLLAGRTPEAVETVAGLPVLELAGLTPVAAREMITEAAASPMPNDQFTELYRRTAGNPLALQELASDPRGPAPEVPGVPATVPNAVAHAFARRIDLLPTEARPVLLIAVVAGGDLGLTASACGRLGLDPGRLAAAEDAGLVTVRDGRVTFRHPLLRAAVYSAAPSSDRHTAHRTVADCLPDAELERRAWHRAAAAWGLDAEAADLLDRAAQRAMTHAGYAVASTAYQRAAELSLRPVDRCRRLLRAAEASWAAGQSDRTGALLDDLADLHPGPEVELAALQLRAAVAARSGALGEARTMVLAAADRTEDPDLQVVLLADAIHAGFYLGDTTTSVALADRILALVPTTSADRARALGLTAAGIARILAGRGGTEEVRAALPYLESDPELRTDPDRWPWLLLAGLFLRVTGAGDRLRSLVDQLRDSAGVGALPRVLFHLARGQATTDAWTRATANYTETVRLSRETGQTTELAAALAGRSWLESRQGAEGACRADAAETLELCADRSIHLLEAWALFARGDLELSLGDADAAIQQLTALTELLTRYGMGDPDLSPVPELVDALLRVGDDAAAYELVPAYAEAADAKGQPWARARAQRAIGLITTDSIDTAFGAALDLHTASPDRFETARTRLAYGERLRRSGRRVDARGQLTEALAIFDGLGAVRWAARAAAELTATGAPVRRSDNRWRPTLTPQELQVCLLLTDGRTTREAAAALFLSPKTVEYHLRKVYTKLGIHSREELVTAMADATD
jgi:DNA-binding CsgD family transcriptional regulator